MRIIPSETFVVFTLPDTNECHGGVIKYSYLDINNNQIMYIIALGNDFEYTTLPNVFQIDDTMVEFLLFNDHSHSYYTLLNHNLITDIFQ